MECIKNKDIVIENEQLRLVVGSDCLVKSLLCKATGEECAEAGEEISLISVTQERPFNNEVKLSHPNKRTTYQGCCLRREGDELIVGFEIAPYKARIGICEKPGYIGFKLIDFIVGPEDYGHLAMDLPPAVDRALADLEAATAKYSDRELILCLSYGGRTEIAAAARALAEDAAAGRIDPASIDEAAVASRLYLPDVPDPDLIVRTSGEERLSNFLLWQAAYAEFHFTPVLWPDFGEDDFKAALDAFAARHRRFGGV